MYDIDYFIALSLERYELQPTIVIYIFQYTVAIAQVVEH